MYNRERSYFIMLDFTADIKYSKQQSAKRKKDAVAIIDEIFKEFIRSQDNSAIIFTQKNCGFITYDRHDEFLADVTLACNSLTETLTLPFQISNQSLIKVDEKENVISQTVRRVNKFELDDKISQEQLLWKNKSKNLIIRGKNTNRGLPSFLFTLLYL